MQDRMNTEWSRRSHSIASVTVAYNGGRVLRQHLDSLMRQSRALDEIVVVDNSSTDDTRELLAQEYPEVKVIRLAENGGIGGGLAAGLANVISQKKHDWVWIFDQDSLPRRDTLERLLCGLHSLNGHERRTAVLAPRCLNPETGVEYPALSWCGSRYEAAGQKTDEPVAFVDMVISSGSLMRTQAIEEAGLPRADFFMDFVDYEHCLRLRRHGFVIATVHDAVLSHAIGTPTTLKILGRTKRWADHAPWREYYMARNETFTMWKYHPTFFTKAFVGYRLANHALGILLFGKNKVECVRMICRGFVDGCRGRLGIRFAPETSTDRFATQRWAQQNVAGSAVSRARSDP